MGLLDTAKNIWLSGGGSNQSRRNYPEPPNALARAFKYVNDAVGYAKSFQQSSDKMGGFSPMLSQMGDADKYNVQNDGSSEQKVATAISSVWVYSSIKLIADRAAEKAFPQVKRQLATETETIDIGNHPFEQLLKNPNSLMTGNYMTRYLIWWYQLWGNAYVYIDTPKWGTGKPTALYPLPANKITPIPDSERQGVGAYKGRTVIDFAYDINGDSRPIIIRGENIIQFRLPNPLDYWQGLSPLQAISLAIELDRSQLVFAKDFYGKDNAVPSAIISLNADIGENDFIISREAIRQQFGSGKRVTAIIRGGDMDVKTISQNMEQLQWVAGRSFSREEIETAYGVPEGLLRKATSGDGRNAAEMIFARNVIQPLLSTFAEDWTYNVLQPYYGEDLVLEAADVVPQDRALEIQEFNTYRYNRTLNENRKVLGDAPIKTPKLLLDAFGGLDPFNEIPESMVASFLARAQLGFVTTGQEIEEEAEGEAREAEGKPEHPYNEAGSSASLLPAPKDAGSMPGLQSPKQLVDDLTGKLLKPAIEAELGRYRKVARKTIKEGKPVSDISFTSEVLTNDQLELLQKLLLIDGPDALKYENL